MKKSPSLYNIAVVGATGNVGRELLNILAERNFPVNECVALAGAASLGKEVSFGDRTLRAKNLQNFNFKNTDIVLSSAGAKVSAEFAPKAAKAGAVVIDNTSCFRMEKDVPLIVPEVNAAAIAGYKKTNIIANPNCSTIQMLVALKPLHDAAVIKRISVATYQSVSGAGKSAMDELFRQTRAIFDNDPTECDVFAKEIAFNCIPHIDIAMADGSCKEEWKMMVETHKILDPNIKVSATCVRVPVFIGHAEAVNIEFKNPISPAEARQILRRSPGVEVIDEPKEDKYITPLECAGSDATFVSRIRKDDSLKHGLNIWVVSDNLRKGAALNTVQIAELLISKACNLQPKAEAAVPA